MADVPPKLTRISRVMAWLSLAGAVIYPVMDAGVFLVPDTLNKLGAFETHHLGHRLTSAVPFSYRLAALAIDLIPTALAVWALIELYRLFLSYARGAVFTGAALRGLSRIAALMFVQVLLAFAAEAPVSWLLSLGDTSGHRGVTLTITSYDLSYLFMAGVVLVIARVMAEARRVADENASFV